MSHYTIYTMPNCPHCVAAKELFKRDGLEYTEITEFTREELQSVVGPVRTLPQILVKNEHGTWHVGGFTDLQVYRNSGEHPGASVRLLS